MGALFGPGGNSESFYADGFKHTWQAPSWVKKMGLDAYEYQGGNGIRGSADSFKKIGLEAAVNNIRMSVHAPYYISLSGIETEKRLKSIEYIRTSIEAAELLGADIIVIHTGSASKISRTEAISLAKDTLFKTLESVDNTKRIRLGLETMGKINQLGTLDEVIEICKLDPIFCPVVDFGHLNARNIGRLFTNEDSYKVVFDKISNALGADKAENLHCHFSKIEYTKAGEKKHLTFDDNEFGPEFEPLINVISQNGLSPRIICESAGTMAEDALKMKKYYLGI